MAYQNFMGNKDFHPSSIRNIRKVFEAQQKIEMDQKRQEELRLQYIKEQEMYKNKERLGKANPLGFMYEPPPGFCKDKDHQKKETEDDEAEPRLKFDWQKEGKAPPREEYARGKEMRDRPFGIEVRNVKCIKCGKWGHINTDRECPLFGQMKPDTEASRVDYPLLTDWDSIDDGLRFRQCVKDRVVNSDDPLQQFVLSDEETEMQEMLAEFTPKQRRRILKKLAKPERSEKVVGDKDRKKKRKNKHHDHEHKRRRRDRSGRSSDSEDDYETSRREQKKSKRVQSDVKKKKREKTKRRHSKKGTSSRYSPSASSSSSSSSTEEDQWVEVKSKHRDQHKHSKLSS